MIQHVAIPRGPYALAGDLHLPDGGEPARVNWLPDTLDEAVARLLAFYDEHL